MKLAAGAPVAGGVLFVHFASPFNRGGPPKKKCAGPRRFLERGLGWGEKAEK